MKSTRTVFPEADGDELVRLPGLFRRQEFEQVLEQGSDFHVEPAGRVSDGTLRRFAPLAFLPEHPGDGMLRRFAPLAFLPEHPGDGTALFAVYRREAHARARKAGAHE